MKIFAISDIHGKIKALKKLEEKIRNSDAVIITGDITKSGSRSEAAFVLSHIERINANIMAVHGNKDREEVKQYLEEKGYSLHAKCKIIKGIAFFGVGGSSPTPMNTPTEYSEEKIMEFLNDGYSETNGSRKNILVSHAPPKGTRDKTFLGLRGGSDSIRSFMKNNKIDLCLSGHIHEARGIERRRNSIIANPGSFRRGKYLLVEIGEEINVTQWKAR